MRFSSWSWNSGPALYPPCRVLRGFMGVCPTSPHVLCGSGEGIRPCPSWYSVGSAPRVWGPGAFALRAVRSLYDPESRSLVRIAGSKSDLFPVHVGLRQGCPLSPVLFIIFMDRISRRSQGPEGVQPGPSACVLERFAAECEEAAGMRISTSKSEAMVLDRKRVVCPLRVGGEVLPQVEEFKYLGVLFTSEGKMEREIDRRIGLVQRPAVMRSVYRTVVVKKELSRKAKLSIYRSIYVPTLTYGHELWVMTERTRSADTSGRNEFPPCRVAGRSLRDRGGVPGMSHREEASGKTQDTLERLCLSDWPGNASGSPGRAGGSVWGEGGLGISAQTAASTRDPVPDQADENGWMDGWISCVQRMPICFSQVVHHITAHPPINSQMARSVVRNMGREQMMFEVIESELVQTSVLI
ncbi:hypothetical protein L3Q82_003763 [Scortum barcoo]|uniref:Uncharacterized protein n=1 Tax=Scortum barcoo TaxID=214431 RepID=A0ACB8X7F1_9TELE|nr:hypothetical protein L3Q82_003763 [Scortum barcoo]